MLQFTELILVLLSFQSQYENWVQILCQINFSTTLSEHAKPNFLLEKKINQSKLKKKKVFKFS